MLSFRVKLMNMISWVWFAWPKLEKPRLFCSVSIVAWLGIILYVSVGFYFHWPWLWEGFKRIAFRSGLNSTQRKTKEIYWVEDRLDPLRCWFCWDGWKVDGDACMPPDYNGKRAFKQAVAEPQQGLGGPCPPQF